MTGHLVGHVVRRSLQHAQEHLSRKEIFVSRLQQDAKAYEDAGPEMQIKPQELLPILATAIFALLIVWSIDYTIGQVMSSLAMIESPSRTTIVDSKPPPPYTDHPDAPLEKEPLMAENDADVEITVIDHKPITTSIRATVGHLHRVGGFFGRWRGLGLAVLYHVFHGVLTNFFAHLLGFGIIGESICYIVASLFLARLHLAWTHKMIAYPSSKVWFRNIPARKQCKALLLPTLVYAAAEQATIILPIGVAFVLGVANPDHFRDAAQHENCSKLVYIGFSILSVLVTYIAIGLAVLLPASVTLTRIEATLLPEGQETIVPFDKESVMGDIDTSVRGACRALFVQAWRSFDRASRWRLIKLYVKMIFAQIMVMLVAVHLMVAELYVIGGERLALLMKSGAAQLKLAAIEARENAK